MQSALVGKRFGFAPVAKGSRLLVAARCINMQHRFQAFGAPRMAPMFWLSLDMTTSAFFAPQAAANGCSLDSSDLRAAMASLMLLKPPK